MDPKSNRLQLLEPFSKWDGGDISDAQVWPLRFGRPPPTPPLRTLPLWQRAPVVPSPSVFVAVMILHLASRHQHQSPQPFVLQ